jgi:predicted ester cyclase
MSIFRIEDGRIAEQWLLPDMASMEEQLAGAGDD